MRRIREFEVSETQEGAELRGKCGRVRAGIDEKWKISGMLV